MKPSQIIVQNAWKMQNGDKNAGQPICPEFYIQAILNYLDESSAPQQDKGEK